MMTDFSIYEAAVTAGQIALAVLLGWPVAFLIACSRNGRRYDEAIGADKHDDDEQAAFVDAWHAERAVRSAPGA